MELAYLKTFSEVIKTGSFTGAAQKLHLSQSTVTRRVRLVEEQLDCQLLIRSNDDVKLTSQGELVYKKVKEILEVQDELQSRLNLFTPKKELLFACTPTFSTAHLSKILTDFMQGQVELPSLKLFFLNPDEIVDGLAKGSYELAVVEHCLNYDLTSFETVDLSRDEVVFAFASRVGLEAAEVELEELFKHPLYIRGAGCCARKLLEENLQQFGRSLDDFEQLVVCDDLHIIKEALLSGKGVSFLARELLQSHLETGHLKKCRISGFNHEFRRTLVFSDDLPDGDCGNNFIEQILAYFGVKVPLPIQTVYEK